MGMPQVSNRQETIDYLNQAIYSIQSSPSFNPATARGVLDTLTSSDSYIGRGLVNIGFMFLPRGFELWSPETSMEDLSWIANVAINEQVANKARNDPQLTNPAGVYYVPHVNQLREAMERKDSEATLRSLDDLRTALVWQ